MTREQPVIFISYSHKDKRWLEYVHSHLAPAVKFGVIETWDDRRIGGGEEWRRDIVARLNSCAACILLISRHSLTSKFIIDVEVRKMLNRRKLEGAHIYPIVVSPCFKKPAKWLMDLNLRPVDGKALSTFRLNDRDLEMEKIVGEICHIFDHSPRGEHSTARLSDTSAEAATQSSNRAEDASIKAPSQLKIEIIRLTALASKDCERLSISSEDVIEYFRKEERTHPKIFLTSFSSLPMVFKWFIVLFSWDGERTATIGRIFKRNEAYPSHDGWARCLGRYRMATTLPYRSKGVDGLAEPLEAQRTLLTFKGLMDEICRHWPKSSVIAPFSSLFDQANDALVHNDFSTMIVCLETLLSSIHKLLVLEIPKGVTESKGTQVYHRVRKAIRRALFNEENGANAPIDDEGSLAARTKDPQKRMRVLIVDDDESTRESLRQLVRSLGYYTTTSEGAREALNEVIENDFAAILLDVQMPDMDGVEVAQIISRTQLKSKIVMITAFPKEEHRALKVNNVVGWLSKPFTEESLIILLDEIEGRRAFERRDS